MELKNTLRVQILCYKSLTYCRSSCWIFEATEIMRGNYFNVKKKGRQDNIKRGLEGKKKTEEKIGGRGREATYGSVLSLQET